MVVKHCAYRECESDSRYWDREYMRGVCFIRFPNALTNRERCEKWVNACDRKDLTIDCVNDKTYICSKHFVGGNGPTKNSSDPLPPKQLFEANLRHKTLENTCNENTFNKNNYLNINNNNNENNIKSDSNKLKFDSYSQNYNLREIESFNTNNICDKNESIINGNNILLNKLLKDIPNSLIVNNNEKSSNSCVSLINELKQEPKPQSDECVNNKDNYECINNSMKDSLFIPSIASNSMIDNSSPILLSELSNNDKNNTNEVPNNSLPFIIIPSTNHTMIGSTFSVPVIPLDDKQWFNEFISHKLGLKLTEHGLSAGRVGQRLIFSSITGCVVDKQLIIDISGNFDVKVFGISLFAKNNFYKFVPIYITNESEFYSVIDNFCLWKVCVANEIKDHVFKDKIIAIRAFICNTSNTIRTKSCELLIPQNGSTRCKSCRIILSRIRRFKNSLINEIKTNSNTNEGLDNDIDY